MSDIQKIPRDQRPHAVLRITTKEGNDPRLSVIQLNDDGLPHYSRSKPTEHEVVEVLGKYDTFTEAQKHRMALARQVGQYVHGVNITKLAVGLPAFMEHLPSAPRERRELFLELEIEQQEEVLYSLVLATGMPRKRIAQWLFVQLGEIEHIDENITVAARAELDLRIAKKMVGHALANNSPASQTAALYLTKVFLGWNEQGMAEENADPMVNLGAAQSLFEGLSVVETHRDKDGNTTKPPTVLQLVKGAKDTKAA